MKIFVFNVIGQLTENYHSGGGLMIIAENEAHVEELIEREKYVALTEEEWKEVVIYELMDTEEPTIFVFPDAGCC